MATARSTRSGNESVSRKYPGGTHGPMDGRNDRAKKALSAFRMIALAPASLYVEIRPERFSILLLIFFADTCETRKHVVFDAANSVFRSFLLFYKYTKIYMKAGLRQWNNFAIIDTRDGNEAC